MGIGWPDPIPPLVLSFSEPVFEVHNAKSIFGRLTLRLYAQDLRDVNAVRARVTNMIQRVSAANNNIRLIEQSLVEKKNAVDSAKIEGQKVLDRKYQSAIDGYSKACFEHREKYRQLLLGYQQGGTEGLSAYFEAIGRLIALPDWCEQRFVIGIDQAGETLIAEIRLPVLSELQVMKASQSKRSASSIEIKNANKRETIDTLNEIYSLVLLRVAAEFALADLSNRLKSIAVNGWVKYKSKTTGKEQSAFVASLLDSPPRLREISLPDIDPNRSFRHHNGQSAQVIDEVVPIRPQVVIDLTGC